MAELVARLDELTARANPALLRCQWGWPRCSCHLALALATTQNACAARQPLVALSVISPIKASSGKTVRHRVNRSGNRQANQALWRIVMVRLSIGDPATKAYLQRRRAEGKSLREIIRCLKRYVAREIYCHLVRPKPVPTGADLRVARRAAHLSLQSVADALHSWPSRISEFERGRKHDAALAHRYMAWLLPHGKYPPHAGCSFAV